jgi:beta-galactosidase
VLIFDIYSCGKFIDKIRHIATIKVSKAMFGTQVILNGKVIGDHASCFTPGYFNAKSALKTGDNELIIRIGADRGAVPKQVPSGMDFEKERYIPGIFDDVELIMAGTPYITNVQVAPEISKQTVECVYG